MRIDPKGYRICELIHSGSMALVYRAERERDHRRVVLKLLERHLATPDAIARYQHEFEVLEGLRIPGVIEVLGLETVLGAPMLVLDDFNAQSVAKQRREEPLGLNQVLTLALRVTAILSEVHGHDIVHCDINPSNILINRDTGEVKLADFGWSVRAKDDEVDPAEDEEPRAEYEPGGTLAYMSPEQTGRVDRRIDYRTDFYSLGVTLYELCTGRLPFETGDPLALVHCHLAQEPVPPHEVVPDIPVMVSDIIMKLMSKMPEQRYQTAHGCMHDLGECKRQLDDNGTIQAFPLGREDRPERFQIPTRLYGRERESATMRATLARVTAGDRRLLLVTGHPGIGKSALIKELGAAAAGGRRSFLEGKYDQYRRNIPYSALVQGFSTLVRQLLTEPQDRLDEWRRALTQALGASAHVLIEVIPELAVLLGPQPSVPRSGPSETENRFNHAFRGFVNVLCREHPLIVFLDDLQWADAASLRLMKLMLTDPDGGRLLLVGAYRDREVDAAHPLTTLLDQLGDEGLDIDRVSLRPLTLDEVSELLADTLRRGAADCADLAALIMAKTGGNPFFVKQFLLTLHHEQVFEFDRSSSGWRWDLDAVRELPITDNVVDLMVVRMRKLSMGTQRTLQLAACVGNIFDTATLAIICEDSPAAIDDRFAPVIDMGMVRRRPTLGLGGGSARPGGAYAFSHDRVQQAAYALIPANDEAAVHLNIARLLERSLSGEEREVRVFELVEHFVQGAALVDGDDERLRAAGLCLVAGRRAEESMAHESARRFLGAGLAFMPEQSWRDHYELMRDLTMAAAEVEYVNADVATARRLTDELLDNARDLLDKAKVRELQMMFHIAQQEMPEALEIGLDTLSMLGVSLPREPEAVNARVEELREQLDLNQARLAELENHPELTDPRQTMILRILERSATPAFYAEPVLWPLLTHTEVTVCVRHGHSALAAASYIQHAATLCGVNPDLELASGLGALALRLLERFPDPSIEVRASNMFHAFVRPWNEPDRGAVEQLRALVQRGLQAGALEHAFYAAMWCPWFRFQTGDPLDEVHRDQRAYQTLAERHGMVLHRDLIAVTARITRELLGRPADHERAVLQQPVVFLFQWTAQAALHNIMGDRAAALDAAERSEEHASIGVGLPVGAEQQYAYCLAALGALTDLDGDPARTRALLAEVERKQASMLVWAERVPENFLHKWALVAAEHARARNQPPEAMARFEEAIDAARKYGYTREEAMACERAASFYAGLGRKQIGDMYLSDAHLAYRRWGAQAKVMALEQEHPWLAQRQSLVTSGFQSSSGSGRTRTLDLESVVRASQALSSQLVLDQLLATLMKIIIENAGAQRGYLLLTGEDGGPDSLTLEAEGDIGDERFRALPSLPLDHPEARFARTAVSYVSRTRTSLVLSDAADQEPYAHDPHVRTHALRSLLCAPVTRHGELVGLIYLENNRTTNAFTPGRLEVVQTLAAQAAISIENARLYDRLASLNRNLERRVQERTEELAENNRRLIEEVAERTKAQERLVQLQRQMVDTARAAGMAEIAIDVLHHVGNTLNSVSVSTHLLIETMRGSRIGRLSQLVEVLAAHRDDLPRFLTENERGKAIYPFLKSLSESLAREHDKAFEELRCLSEHVAHLIGLVDKQREHVRATDLVEPCSLGEVLQEALASVHADIDTDDIDIVVSQEENPTLWTDRHKLRQILRSLLDQAHEALRESELPERRLTVATHCDDEWIRVEVADNGAGGAREDLSTVFTYGRGAGAGADGYGLHNSALSARQLGGTLTCHSLAPGPGACFVLTLPLRVQAPAAERG